MSKGKWRRDPKTGASIRGQGEKFANGWIPGEGELDPDTAALRGADMFNVSEIAEAAGFMTPDYFIERAVRPAGFERDASEWEAFEWDVFDRAEEPREVGFEPGPKFKLFLDRNPDLPERPEVLVRKRREPADEYQKRVSVFDRQLDENDKLEKDDAYRERLSQYKDGAEVAGYYIQLRDMRVGGKIPRLYRAVGLAAPSSQVEALGATLRNERIAKRVEGRVRARKARQTGRG